MGDESSIEKIKAKFVNGKKGRSALCFSGIKDISKNFGCSCICSGGDSNVSGENLLVKRGSSRRSKGGKGLSDTRLENFKSEELWIDRTRPDQRYRSYELVTTIVRNHQGFDPHNKHLSSDKFQPSQKSIQTENPSIHSHHHSNSYSSQSSFIGSSLFSQTSLLSSLPTKIIKKDLNISTDSLSDLDDHYEDVPNPILIHTTTKYKGETLNNIPHGYGTEVYPDGSKYEGKFNSGLRSGQGIYTWPDQNCYKGSFKDNERNGFGTFEWSNGNKYEGMWKGSKMHGEGKFLWKNGSLYIGGYKDGVRHGEGRFVLVDGKIVKGKWIEGCLQGKV